MKNVIMFGLLMLLCVGFVSAFSWTQQSGSGVHNWTTVASSVDCGYLSAGADGLIFTSADFGVSWNERNSLGYGLDVASSGNGSTLLASNGGNSLALSHNFGVSWSPFAVSDLGGYGVAMSNDSKYMFFASAYDGEGCGCGGLTGSTNYGVSWGYVFGGTDAVTDVASSDNGSIVAVLHNVGNILVSLDYASSYTSRASSLAWSSVDVDSDGSFMIASVNGGYLYVSDDFGVTWIQETSAGSRSWSGVSSSADGSVLFAVVDGGFIYSSNDSGVSWVEESGAGSRSWKGVAVSADGSRVVAVDYGGFVWTGEFVSCVESWVQDLPSSCDGVLDDFVISYTDVNVCGTVVDLPVNNGSVVDCCVESWSEQFSGSCSGQDRVRFFVDVNLCGTSFTLPVNNGSAVACDVSSGGGGSGVVVPQTIIPSITTTSSTEATSAFGDFINSIINWFKRLFGW